VIVVGALQGLERISLSRVHSPTVDSELVAGPSYLQIAALARGMQTSF
jgi:hypothetical protein